MANQNDYSIAFDGIASVVTLTGKKVPVAAFSVSFWYKPTVVDINDRIIDQQDAGPVNGWTIVHITNNNPQIQFVIRNGASSVAALTSTDMVMNQWNHVVATYEVDEVRLYVNGVMQGTPDFSATMTDSTAVIKVGRRSPSAGQYMTGNLCNLQIYNRPLYGSDVRRLYAQKAPLIGCTNWYRMDENSGTVAVDSRGASPGSLTSCTYSSDVPWSRTRNTLPGPRSNPNLRPSTYLVFDGVDDYIDLGVATIIPDATAACTVSAWVYRDGNGIRAIIGNTRDSTTKGWVFKISNDAVNKLEFTFRNAAGSQRAWIGNVTIPDSRWCHVAVTMDGSTARFYVNGNEDEKETISVTSTIRLNEADNVRIGHRVAAGAGQEFFKGKLAKVAVWSVALSNAQIKALYLADDVPSTGLLGYWKLDEGSGTTAVDSSSGAHNGTISGAVYGTE